MIFSMLSSRTIVSRLLSRNAAGLLLAARPVPFPLSTRNLFTTSRVALPATATATSKKPSVAKAAAAPTKKAAVGAKKAVKKTTVKKKIAAPKRKKAAAKPKKKPARKAKKVVAKKAVQKLEYNPPTRPLTPFFIFMSRYRAGADPSAKKPVKTIASEAGLAWRALSDHEKAPFKDEYAALQDEYRRKLPAFFDSVDPKTVYTINRRKAAKGKKKIRLPPSLKKPMSSYLLYHTERLANNPNKAHSTPEFLALSKESGEKWRSMSEAEKQPYTDRAAKALSEWKAKFADRRRDSGQTLL